MYCLQHKKEQLKYQEHLNKDCLQLEKEQLKYEERLKKDHLQCKKEQLKCENGWLKRNKEQLKDAKEHKKERLKRQNDFNKFLKIFEEDVQKLFANVTSPAEIVETTNIKTTTISQTPTNTNQL